MVVYGGKNKHLLRQTGKIESRWQLNQLTPPLERQMKQMLISTADTDEKMLGGIFILAGAGLFFWFVFAAFRDGETSIGGEAGSWSAKKEKKSGGVLLHSGCVFSCGCFPPLVFLQFRDTLFF